MNVEVIFVKTDVMGSLFSCRGGMSKMIFRGNSLVLNVDSEVEL